MRISKISPPAVVPQENSSDRSITEIKKLKLELEVEREANYSAQTLIGRLNDELALLHKKYQTLLMREDSDSDALQHSDKFR
jgi:hypothetical protein